MAFGLPGGGLVNAVVVLLVIGVVGAAMFPEIPQLRWALWLALGIGAAGGAVVALSYLAAEKRQGVRRSLLNRLVAMHTRPDTPENRAAAYEVFDELSDLQVGLPDLVATPGFPEASATPGPHREPCMRLALRHGMVGGPLWQEVLRRGVSVLRKADLTEDELERLELWAETESGRVERVVTRGA